MNAKRTEVVRSDTLESALGQDQQFWCMPGFVNAMRLVDQISRARLWGWNALNICEERTLIGSFAVTSTLEYKISVAIREADRIEISISLIDKDCIRIWIDLQNTTLTRGKIKNLKVFYQSRVSEGKTKIEYVQSGAV